VNGQGLGLAQAVLGGNLSDGVLRLALQGQRLALEQFTAHDGSQGGTLSVTGDATLIDTPTARLKVQANHFAALQRVDRRVVASGLVDLMLSQDNLQAQGQVKIDEGLIDITHSDAPTVGDDVNVVNRPGSTEEAADDAGGAGSQRQIAVQLDVDLGKQLRLKGRGVDGRLTGGLRLTTPTNRLRANGTIKVEQGTYAAYGQKLVIERGNVNFVGPLDNPKLDILAMRAQSASTVTTDVKVGVMITGTAQDPRIRLYSDPSMSDTEKLSWLILGRGPTELGGADNGLLQTAAVALLSGENSGPGSNIVTALGLD
jgi:translocation and assembly module TamB